MIILSLFTTIKCELSKDFTFSRDLILFKFLLISFSTGPFNLTSSLFILIILIFCIFTTTCLFIRLWTTELCEAPTSPLVSMISFLMYIFTVVLVLIFQIDWYELTSSVASDLIWNRQLRRKRISIVNSSYITYIQMKLVMLDLLIGFSVKQCGPWGRGISRTDFYSRNIIIMIVLNLHHNK